MKKIFGTFILSALLLAALFIVLFKNKGSDAEASAPEAKKFHKDRKAQLKEEQEQLEEAIQRSLADQACFPIDLISIQESKKLALKITKKDNTDNRDIQEIDLYLAELSEEILAKNQLIIGIKSNENYNYYIAEIKQDVKNISLTLASESKQKQIKNIATQSDIEILQDKINKCKFKLKDEDGMGLRPESAVLDEYLNTSKTDPSDREIILCSIYRN